MWPGTVRVTVCRRSLCANIAESCRKQDIEPDQLTLHADRGSSMRSKPVALLLADLFTSDNGFFFGEHWLSQERRLPYEESVRLPLLVRYPPLAQAGSKVEGLSLSVDIAPTVLEVGQAEIGDHIQGRSLLPLLQGNNSEWRESVLIEFYTYENPRPWLMDMDYTAIRTDRYKLIHWIQHPNECELYDLETDPYEMRNLVDEPSMSAVLRELENDLSRLVIEATGLASARY